MLSKYFNFCILFNVFGGLVCEGIPSPTTDQKVLEHVVPQLTGSTRELTPYTNATVNGVTPKCIQIVCKFVCFNGKSNEIENDISTIAKKSNRYCTIITELLLYNYEFPDKTLSYGFLGNYSDKVHTLYLGAMDITDIAAGTFANGWFHKIYMENLKLKELRGDYFQGGTYMLSTLSIIQREMPVQYVNANFLSDVKYTINQLTMQVGLTSISNLTGNDCLLNNLIYIDFSHSKLHNHLIDTDFRMASMVEHIDLSHSNLEYLPPYLFSDTLTTLKYLNLRFNKLKTISRNIFGWRVIKYGIQISLFGNEWSCSCQLQRELKEMMISYDAFIICHEPIEYRGVTAIEIDFCNKTLEINETTEFVSETTTKLYFHVPESTVTDSDVNVPGTTFANAPIIKPLMKLNCLSAPINIGKRLYHSIRWPLIFFKVVARKNFIVDVVIESFERNYDSIGIVWFSRATSNYRNMEINYNEYGLGCYKPVSLVTTVKNLIHNRTYSFCFVFKKQLNVSPFNCKSIHVALNAATKTSDSLTRNMSKPAVSLVVFGIILFLFVGILMIYLLLKRKPILLNGSKRVTTLTPGSNNIIVLPKKKSIRQRNNEGKFTKHWFFNITQKRRKSIDSDVSYQSYINANLYEVIPAFVKGNSLLTSNMVKEKAFVEMNNTNSESDYLTPLESLTCLANSVQYADVERHTDASSYDAFPQLPAQPPQSLLALNELQSKSEYAQIGHLYILDSQV